MRLGGEAKALVAVTNKNELVQALEWAKNNSMKTLVLGDGSNVIFSDGFDGLVIINRISGFNITEDNEGATVILGAGENWDACVEQTVQKGLSGIEKLSAIPGTAGATPVQNVGAYGAEIADTFVNLQAYDMQTSQFVTLSKEDCHFSYRNSIFKATDDRRYIITSITLHLTNQPPKPPFYDSLQNYLDQHDIHAYSPQTIRDAVMAIRSVKLPDPARIANTGSFFKNPIISQHNFDQLAAAFPTIPHWPTKDGRVKIAAGWLIEHAGLKGYAAHGMKLYEHNALVFVNEGAKDYNDLAAFKAEVIAKVHDTFGITLQQEPELL
jgi:UDP-N-acetylmuramate dehydrogenase